MARLDDQHLRQTLVADIRRIDAAPESMERIDVASRLWTIQADFADIGVDVRYDGPDRLVAEVKPDALMRVVTNLCDDSPKFAGHARITVKAGEASCSIAVADNRVRHRARHVARSTMTRSPERPATA